MIMPRIVSSVRIRLRRSDLNPRVTATEIRISSDYGPAQAIVSTQTITTRARVV
jgi:hypothetical protein